MLCSRKIRQQFESTCWRSKEKCLSTLAFMLLPKYIHGVRHIYISAPKYLFTREKIFVNQLQNNAIPTLAFTKCTECCYELFTQRTRLSPKVTFQPTWILLLLAMNLSNKQTWKCCHPHNPEVCTMVQRSKSLMVKAIFWYLLTGVKYKLVNLVKLIFNASASPSCFSPFSASALWPGHH